MNELILPIVCGVIRHAVGWFGVAHVVGHDEQHQIAGALVVLISVVWSVWDKYQSRKVDV